MTTPTHPPAHNAGIDVCSGPSLSRAERLAQDAARFAPRTTPTRPAQQAPLPDPRVPVGE